MIYTRMSTNSINDSLISGLYSNRSNLTKLQEQLSSGDKVTTTSDDPTAASTIIKGNVSLDKISSYLSNISGATSELDETDSVLTQLNTYINDAKDLATTGSTSTYSHDDLLALKTQVDQLIQSVKDVGNTQYNGKFIFSGQDTATAPFTDATSSSTTGTVTTDISGTNYVGSSSSGEYERSVTISDGVVEGINVSGDTIIGNCTKQTTTDTSTTPSTVTTAYTGSGLLKTLYQLSDDLGAEPIDYDAIRAHIDELSTCANTVTNEQAKLGAVNSRLSSTKTQLTTDKTNIKTQVSEAQSIDMMQVISDLTQQETSLQASLQTTSSIMGISLLNYM